MIRTGIADDHPELRTALRLLLGLAKDIEVVFEATNGLEAVKLVEQHQPDVLVLDMRMPELDGLNATRRIIFLSPFTRVILISSFDGKDVIQLARDARAHGFVHKGDLFQSLVTAIKTVYRGGQFFPPEEP